MIFYIFYKTFYFLIHLSLKPPFLSIGTITPYTQNKCHFRTHTKLWITPYANGVATTIVARAIWVATTDFCDFHRKQYTTVFFVDFLRWNVVVATHVARAIWLWPLLRWILYFAMKIADYIAMIFEIRKWILTLLYYMLITGKPLLLVYTCRLFFACDIITYFFKDNWNKMQKLHVY